MHPLCVLFHIQASMLIESNLWYMKEGQFRNSHTVNPDENTINVFINVFQYLNLKKEKILGGIFCFTLSSNSITKCLLKQKDFNQRLPNTFNQCSLLISI